jgi:hypothetical protein
LGDDPVPDLPKPDDWAKLTTAERIAQCYAFAREAAQLAQAAHPDKKQHYRDLAAKWHTLAAEIEHAGRGRPIQPGA